MLFTPHGHHLIAGQWRGTSEQTLSTPAHGAAHSFSVGTPKDVDDAVLAAEDAFWSYGYSRVEIRAALLDTIADEIEARGAEITEIGCQETGLPEARLQGERARTTGQLRMFADHIRSGAHLDLRHDPALPDRAPLPRPDLKMVQRPIGPVAVFGASNFPLAFSTAGGDTAAALAAGCPVVVKGHEAHPGTGEIIAEAIHAALGACNLHPGVFSLIQAGGREVGAALVQHPLIRAVGFTGSLKGGRALFDLCSQRPEPIAFFGELGAINPIFVLDGALAARGADIATGWAASLTMGAGQFCTNPGVVLMTEGPDAETFAQTACAALADSPAQTMLTDGISAAYNAGCANLAQQDGVEQLLSPRDTPRGATPTLLRTTAEAFLNNPALSEEVFGPLGLIVTLPAGTDPKEIAHALEGQLTCTLQMDSADTEAAQRLMPILERKAGRILINGFPTGVEVADSMVHGGPYPASTNFGATSVGTLSIRRFLRPVCYQNMSEDLLPSG